MPHKAVFRGAQGPEASTTVAHAGRRLRGIPSRSAGGSAGLARRTYLVDDRSWEVASRHLKRYLAEFDFRYNQRVSLGINDPERTEAALRGIVGKRLAYEGSSVVGG